MISPFLSVNQGHDRAEHRAVTEPRSPAETARKPRLRILIPLVVGCAFFMEGLDSTMLAVAIPDMAKGLGESPLRLNLVITTYLLSLAVFIPVSGWIADRLGTRLVFCVAIAIFATGSALCGLSTSLPMILVMRVLQGFGGAMMTPVGRLILLRSFPRSDLVSAMNWMTIPAMIGPTVGPIVGGFVTTYFSWRGIFYLNLPIGILGVVLALWLMEDFRAPAPTRFDLRGFFIAGAGLALLELAIENVGPDDPRTSRGDGFRFRRRHPPVLHLARATARGPPRSRAIAHPHIPHRHRYRQHLPDGSRRDAVSAAIAVPGRIRSEPVPIGSADVLVEPRRDAGADAFQYFLAVFGFPPAARRRCLLGRCGNSRLRHAAAGYAGVADCCRCLALRMCAQHPISRPQYDQLCRCARPGVEQEHQRRRRCTATGKGLWHRRRRSAVSTDCRLADAHDRRFRARLFSDCSVAARVSPRLLAPF